MIPQYTLKVPLNFLIETIKNIKKNSGVIIIGVLDSKTLEGISGGGGGISL